MAAVPSSASSGPINRADGTESRARLVRTALRLFAEQGFQRTSTREIAEAAQVNISAISYYFGDKAGLYRAAFFEPLGGQTHPGMPTERAGCAALGPHPSLPAMLRAFYADFLAPLKQGEDMRLVMRLHFREMVEPTGLWADEIENEIKPQHQMMVATLTELFGLQQPDDDVQRLTFAVVGLAVHFFVGREIIDGIAPQLLASPDAVDTLADRLARYAEAMIHAEKSRRGLPFQENA
jgi:AcrR family transcriptional regulator